MFLILLVHSSLGIERTGRLFVDNDPHGLQVQVDHLLQELNALKSDFNREISYLKSQLATQGQEIIILIVHVFFKVPPTWFGGESPVRLLMEQSKMTVVINKIRSPDA